MPTIRSFFENKKGDIVIWQLPNIPLSAWALASVAAHLIEKGRLHAGLQSTASGFLLIWTYLEITKGASPFRRVLGAVIFALVILHFFSK